MANPAERDSLTSLQSDAGAPAHMDFPQSGDEARDEDDDEEEDAEDDAEGDAGGRGDTPPHTNQDELSPESGSDSSEMDAREQLAVRTTHQMLYGRNAGLNLGQVQPEEQEGEYDDGQSTDDSGDDTGMHRAARGYDKAAFANLDVPPEVARLFQCIDEYTPEDIELETKFKPFIPEYLPAVGDIDDFVKIPRPDSKKTDGQRDSLGLYVLDEPGKQSDPSVLEMGLRFGLKKAGLPSMHIRGIENADKKPKEVMSWVEKISNLHKEHPSPKVNYTRPMPSIEALMQEWPPEVEELLEKIKLPNASLEVDLKTYVRILCSILDIPVHTNVIESLHVLFTLFSEFKENPHFNTELQQSGGPESGNSLS
eukprot:TRINITY_DN645_c5_g1_i1.p1 TRINITY_DN645_c5_g1~~TRINITY_DN645_c5_g1_i1.p1  ORF type:complete len:382 (+),score=113.78 TRINITY_DN645_c5_g1_i1:47-1147(+)